MTEQQTRRPGLWSAPGDGVLARSGDLILLTGGAEAELLDRLLAALEQAAAAGGDGRRLADMIEDVLGAGDRPPLIALGPSGAGLVVLMAGTAWTDITTEEGTRALPGGQPGWLIRSTLPGPVLAIHAGLDAGQRGAARTDRYSHLDSGSVRAGRLSYYASPPAAEAGRQPGAVPTAGSRSPAERRALGAGRSSDLHHPEDDRAPAAGQAAGAGHTAAASPDPAPAPAPEPAVRGPFEAVLLTGESLSHAVSEAGDRPPLPPAAEPVPADPEMAAESMVMGAYCKNGHFDDPEARFCAVCGISMNQQTLVPRLGPRPPLGLLLLDTGAVLQLDTDYVIGREPELDPAVMSGEARPLSIPDGSGTLSRVHAQIKLVDWNVLLTDLGSANGTRIRPPGDSVAEQLTPQVPVVLRPGSRVDLGGRRLHYESHRGR